MNQISTLSFICVLISFSALSQDEDFIDVPKFVKQVKTENKDIGLSQYTNSIISIEEFLN